MSARGIGTILLLAASLGLGVVLGEVNFGLFRKTMPPMAISTFNQGAAHMVFFLCGVGAGLVVFIWALLAIFLARFFKPAAKVKPPA